MSLFLLVNLPTKLATFWRAHLAPAAGADSPRRDALSLLVIRLDSLGDVVLTTPLFRELKRAFPESSCTVVVQDAFRSLLVTNPNIDEIIGMRRLRTAWLPARVRSLVSVLWLYWGRLRGRRFDVVISPRWDVDDRLATLLCSLVDAGKRVGYSEAVSPAKQRHNRGFDATFDICLYGGPLQHEVLRNLEFVRVLGGKVEDRRLEITLTQRDRDFASKLLASVPATSTLVAVGIGGRSASRRWALENYAQCLAQLWKERRMQPVLICSDDEWEEAGRLGNLLCCEPIIVSGAPLRKVCALLQQCDLFIGNDSGSAHLAGAMNCKTIVISRHPSNGDPDHANSPIRFAPYCDRVRVLQPAAGLDGCSTACLSAEPHCIKAVSVEQVVTAAHEMLRRDPASPSCVHTNAARLHNGHSRPPINPHIALSKAADVSQAGRSRPVALP